jgi:hypothetical protein
MAIFTRVNGDAGGVVNVDAGRNLASGVVINTGIAAPLSAFKITASGTLAGDLVTGGAVETILRALSGNATILAYQVDTTKLSVLVERSGWASDTAANVALTSLGNIGVASAITVTALTSAGGIGLA